MVGVPVTQDEGFTREDLAWLPRIAGAEHELVDGSWTIRARGRSFTDDDLVALPDVPQASRQLLDGVVVMVPAPSLRHQGFVLRLALLLDAARSQELRVRPAPLDVRLFGTTTMQPDVVVIRPQPADADAVEGAPELAVEVLSLSTRTHDLVAKRRLLEEAGCPSYWIIDPATPPVLSVLELVDGAYVEVARVSGQESWTASRPFPVTIVPDELVDD